MLSNVEKKGMLGRAGQMALLSASHALNDFYALLISPLLPVFEANFALSHTLSTSLLTLCNVFGSMVQPIWGLLGDRFDRRWFVLIGTGVAAVFTSLIGLSPNAVWLTALLILGACGVGFFHPNAAAMASSVSRETPGASMSVFLMSGAVGIAAAPLVITWLVSRHGLHATWMVMAPGVAATLILAATLKKDKGEPHHPEDGTAPQESEGRPRTHAVGSRNFAALFWLFLAVVLRAAATICFTNLIPLFAAEMGMTLEAGGRMQSLYIISGCAGGITAGFLSDRISRRAIMLFSCAACVPFLYGVPHAVWQVRAICLMLGGATLAAGSPLHVLVAQELQPRAASTISGVMMGLAWSVGGITLPVFGLIADKLGTGTALRVGSVLPLLAMVCIMVVRRHAFKKRGTAGSEEESE